MPTFSEIIHVFITPLNFILSHEASRKHYHKQISLSKFRKVRLTTASRRSIYALIVRPFVYGSHTRNTVQVILTHVSLVSVVLR